MMRKMFVLGLIVAITGLVIAIILPGFARARVTASAPPCIINLHKIDTAKIEAGKLHGWPEGTDCDNPTNKALVNQWLKPSEVPKCPDGGTYAYNPLGVNPECSIVDWHRMRKRK